MPARRSAPGSPTRRRGGAPTRSALSAASFATSPARSAPSPIRRRPMSAAVARALAARAMAVALGAAAQEESGFERRRPGVIKEAPKREPSAAPPTSAPAAPAEVLPVPDRWRIMRSLGLLPYDPWDPYNPNQLKGDLPLASGALEGWFVNVSAVLDAIYEARR